MQKMVSGRDAADEAAPVTEHNGHRMAAKCASIGPVGQIVFRRIE